MKAMRWIRKGVLTTAVIAGLLMSPLGCGGGFLGLEDYGRDLLFGGLAAALLSQNLGDNGDGDGAGQTVTDIQGPTGPEGEAGPQGEPGPDGQSGPDGEQGSQGEPGEDGPQGEEGPAGEDGPAGEQGPQGETGPAGPTGATGQDGSDGPSLFSIFVDDFFASENDGDGSLPVNTVNVREPKLGFNDGDGNFSSIAYRVVVPEIYDAGNDVTMRMFFDVTEIGSPAGLDGEVLNKRDFLAYEISTYLGCSFPGDGCGEYTLIGVEFFESAAGAAFLAGATMFTDVEDITCPELPDRE
ncbi:MAG: hypothetical protein ACYTHJ_12205 [Planctomycetota bacterium]|jgi:hypothetical protein